MTNEMVVIIFILSLSLIGYLIRSLTFLGACTACLVGSSIYISFGWDGIILLGIFFASSSLWSHVKSQRKLIAEQMNAKGSQRDSVQVIANGGIPLLVSILALLWQDFEQWNVLYAIAIASANSDTWASEIGTLSKRKPRLLLTFKKVETGTSGAVSTLGTIAAFLGSAIISISATILFELSWQISFLILLSGFFGHVVDTLLGGTIQVKYRCTSCHVMTEKQVHCRKKTAYVKGLPFVNNDFVNIVSISFITAFSLIILILL
ncbi:DUF92 domain-containing protein [Bacillus sp. FJAT-47783]|uniref:DUF92 domain-containing protein n=1 Tax=Bacillus sp. FJAT-47783 TaxID=2922712 RepID=UPI001FACFFF6|nr:DUF92 domain-containing protein [Bacillus sp. FJAT-47783]